MCVLKLGWNVPVKLHAVVENSSNLHRISSNAVENHMPADVEGTTIRKKFLAVFAPGRERIASDFREALLK